MRKVKRPCKGLPSRSIARLSAEIETYHVTALEKAERPGMTPHWQQGDAPNPSAP